MQVEPLRLKPSLLFLRIKGLGSLLTFTNLVPSIACALQIILFGRDIFIQFEISNKMLFAGTKIITFNMFDLFK